MKKCGSCDVYFCSKTCQKRAWPQHKLVCGENRDVQSTDEGIGNKSQKNKRSRGKRPKPKR